MTETAESKANARATANAEATQDALSAAMTATAAAMPTQTPVPTPEPTATPAPIAVTGKISDISGGQVVIAPTGGGEAAAFAVPADASITRDGDSVALSKLHKGDSVSLTVDGSTRAVREISANAPAQSLMSRLSLLVFVLPALAIIPLILFLKGRDGAGDPFIVKRVASA